MATRLVSRICWGGVKGSSLRLQLATVVVLVAASSSAWAQSPEPRLVAAENAEEPNLPVWETTIAAGVNKVMSVYRVGVFGQADDIGYAVATVVEHIPPGMGAPSYKPWRWVEEGLVPVGEVPDVADPSVAYDTVTGNFVLAGLEKSPRWPVVAIYDASLGEFVELVEDHPGWARIYLGDDPNQPPPAYSDKPWIVAGEVIPPTNGHEHQELYICYMSVMPPVPVVLRSVDGGYTWNGGEVKIGGQTVYGGFPQPAVEGDGPLYIALTQQDEPGGPMKIRFLRGQDVDDPNYPIVWDYLYGPDDPNDPNDFLEVGFYTHELSSYLAIANSSCRANLFPLLAVDPGTDPNNPDVLYLVYHDTVEEPNIPPDPPWDIDVDVFLHKLTEQEDGTWLAGGRVQVNDSDDPNAASPTDQFHPAVTVTPGPTPEETRVHVIFYDDRRFETQVDFPWPDEPKFDVFYAYSEDAGQSFEPQLDRLLFLNDPDDPNDPAAVDYADVDPNPEFPLADYIGIARQVQGSGYRIWTSYMGTYEDDPTEHKSVIWSSQIRWASP